METGSTSTPSSCQCQCEATCIGFDCIRKRVQTLVNVGQLQQARTLLETALDNGQNSDILREELRKIYHSIVAKNDQRAGTVALPMPPILSASDRHMFTLDEENDTNNNNDNNDSEMSEKDDENNGQTTTTRTTTTTIPTNAITDSTTIIESQQQQQQQQQQRKTDITNQKIIDTLSDIFNCVICCRLLYQPVTTTCGHTFCRTCLYRAISYTDACPMCRTVIHDESLNDTALSLTLQDAIQAAFPKEYEERRLESIEEEREDAKAMRRLPIFPLNVVIFPTQRFPMHVFEQRYRLMLRRVMRGSKKFGIVRVCPDPDVESDGTIGRLSNVGCIVEVTKSHHLPDGRSLIDTVGRERFRMSSYTDLDGYYVADAEVFRDNKIDEDEEDTQGEEDKKTRLKKLEDKARRIVENLVSRADGLPVIQRALQRAGQIPPQVPPPSKGPGPLGLWIASLLVVDDERRQRLLESQDSEARLLEMIRELDRVQASCERATTRIECPIQ